MVVTFVPFFDIAKTYNVLDVKRRNKQITECIEIISAIELNKAGYKNHPALLMWKDNVDALKVYYNIMLRLWRKDGGKGTRVLYNLDEDSVEWPWWWNWEVLALSHKLSLLRKSKLYTLESLELTYEEARLKNTCGYIWPSRIGCVKNLPIEDLCDPIGAGAPAQYRWSLEIVAVWITDRTHNPKTGRKISTTAKTGVYKDLIKAEDYYRSVGLLTNDEVWTVERAQEEGNSAILEYYRQDYRL